MEIYDGEEVSDDRYLVSEGFIPSFIFTHSYRFSGKTLGKPHLDYIWSTLSSH